mgnify:CR=1 FL=1
MKKITILVPAYNEEESLPFLYERVSKIMNEVKDYEFELLFVNDGSKDNTLNEIKKLREQDKRVCYVDFSRNFGKEIAMIFQDPMTALNPTLTIGTQLMEPIMLHQNCGKKEAWTRAVDVLKRVGIAAPEKRMKEYPHQLSGGQCQRVAIARALALQPDILCFDEPTSALDPELTGEVLKVIRELADQNTTMIIVTHEMAFARDVADHVIFMDDGRIVEQGDPRQMFENPSEERTKQFLSRFHEG